MPTPVSRITTVDLAADQPIGEIDGLGILRPGDFAHRRADAGAPPIRSMRRAMSSARRLSNAATRKPAKLGASVSHGQSRFSGERRGGAGNCFMLTKPGGRQRGRGAGSQRLFSDTCKAQSSRRKGKELAETAFDADPKRWTRWRTFSVSQLGRWLQLDCDWFHQWQLRSTH